MPGVVLYGKSWRWASDDLPLLAMISCVLYFTGVLVLMAYVPDIVDTPGCPAFEEYKLFYILSTSMGLKFVLSLCEVFVSLRGSWHPPPTSKSGAHLLRTRIPLRHCVNLTASFALTGLLRPCDVLWPNRLKMRRIDMGDQEAMGGGSARSDRLVALAWDPLHHK